MRSTLVGTRPGSVLRPLGIGLLSLALITCGDEATSPRLSAPPTVPAGTPLFATSGGSVTLAGAGNVANCKTTGDEATALLLDSIPGTVFADGDNAYDNGSLTQYQTCYGPSWGRHKSRTAPTPGERDYKTAGASGYFSYFGAAAGDPTKGYYSYDLGTWHVVVLNSAISTAAGSAQELWLRSDLAAHPAMCTVAYWHHPLVYSKGDPGVNTAVRPLWNDLYAAGAEVVVNAHYAFYERFAPQRPDLTADTALGIREFIVGTGGAETVNPDRIRANSQVRHGGTFGVLQLTLDSASYSWRFVPVAGQTFTDSGTTVCHRAPNQPPVAVPGGPYASKDTVRFNGSGSYDPDNDVPLTYAWNFGDGSTGAGPTPQHVYAPGTYTVTLTVTDSLGSVSTPVTTTATISSSASASASSGYTLVGAGDVASCSSSGDDSTAVLLDSIGGAVFTSGDNAYVDGSDANFTNCYNPTWGRHKTSTRPTPGIHDYRTAGAAGYFNYFGAAAGDTGKGYYSYDLGTWHVVALNTNIDISSTSTQLQWLKNDLAAHPAQCTVAYWYRPRFSSGATYGDAPAMQAAWQVLYDAGAELVMNGHEHMYERFAPQKPDGTADPTYGIREFVAGTGGAELGYPIGTIDANSEVVNNQTFGVLALTLGDGAYSWRFVPIHGRTFTDSGSGLCHGAPGSGGTNHPPTANPGGPYSGRVGTAIQFNGTGSSDPDGDTLTYAWTFGDGGIGTGPTPTHTYATARTDTVTLVVTDSHGASSVPAATTAAISDTNRTPTANPGGPYAGLTNTAIQFDGTRSSDPDGDTLTYAWTFGDGGTGTGPRPTHTYTTARTDTVTLVVTDSHGASSAPGITTASISDTNRTPTANPGGPYSGLVGTAVQFDGTRSSDPDGDPLTYAWTFGDGTAGTGPTPTHTYSAVGTDTVTLIVTDSHGASSAPATTTATIASPTQVLVGAGNIASCTSSGDEATASLLDSIPGTVFTAGDHAYPNGVSADFANCYNPSWGRHKARTLPAMGNRDYDSTGSSAAYFNYFGAAAGPAPGGYYSYDLGAWHVIVLNSNTSYVSTAAGSPQEQWLRADLAGTTKACVVAIWHNPRFYSTTSSTFYPSSSVKPFWDDLYAAHAELILNAHMGDYERFAPQTPDGVADPANGVREFIVGTGGKGHDSPNTLIIPNSEVQISGVYGVLKLTLGDGTYAWQFVPVAGQTATDSGTGTCH